MVLSHWSPIPIVIALPITIDFHPLSVAPKLTWFSQYALSILASAACGTYYISVCKLLEFITTICL